MTVSDWFWAGVDAAVGTLAFLGVILGAIIAVFLAIFMVVVIGWWLTEGRKLNRRRRMRR